MGNPLDKFSSKRGSVDVKIRPIPRLAEFYRLFGVKLAAPKFDEAMETWRQDLQRILPSDEQIENTITTIIQTVVNVTGTATGGGGTTTPPTPPTPPFDPAALIALINQLADDLSAHIAQVIVHGTSSPVVGETDEQSLERKTIGINNPRNARFVHVLQVNQISGGESFTVPAGFNMIVAGDFTIEDGGELVVEVGGNFAVVGENEFTGIPVTTGDELLEDQVVVGAGGSQLKSLESPGDATKFLNGADIPDFAQVKDSDLALSDITDNDADTSKHGFMRKLTGDSSDIYRGDGTFAPVIIPEPPPGGAGTVTNDASLTDNAVVVGDGGTDGVKSLVALGTAGDVLTSNGPGVPPSFQAPAAAVQVFSGHYGGGVPTDVPTTSAAIAYDLDPPYVMSKWDGAAWS